MCKAAKDSPALSARRYEETGPKSRKGLHPLPNGDMT